MTLTHRGGAYDDDDQRFVEELGRHIGLAVANAALFERERAVAEALQQSLLPPRLPDVPGLEIACRYEPGGIAAGRRRGLLRPLRGRARLLARSGR